MLGAIGIGGIGREAGADEPTGFCDGGRRRHPGNSCGCGG